MSKQQGKAVGVDWTENRIQDQSIDWQSSALNFPRTSRSPQVYKLVFDSMEFHELDETFIPDLGAVGDFIGGNPQPRDGTKCRT